MDESKWPLTVDIDATGKAVPSDNEWQRNNCIRPLFHAKVISYLQVPLDDATG